MNNCLLEWCSLNSLLQWGGCRHLPPPWTQMLVPLKNIMKYCDFLTVIFKPDNFTTFPFASLHSKFCHSANKLVKCRGNQQGLATFWSSSSSGGYSGVAATCQNRNARDSESNMNCAAVNPFSAICRNSWLLKQLIQLLQGNKEKGRLTELMFCDFKVEQCMEAATEQEKGIQIG